MALEREAFRLERRERADDQALPQADRLGQLSNGGRATAFQVTAQQVGGGGFLIGRRRGDGAGPGRLDRRLRVERLDRWQPLDRRPERAACGMDDDRAAGPDQRVEPFLPVRVRPDGDQVKQQVVQFVFVAGRWAHLLGHAVDRVRVQGA